MRASSTASLACTPLYLSTFISDRSLHPHVLRPRKKTVDRRVSSSAGLVWSGNLSLYIDLERERERATKTNDINARPVKFIARSKTYGFVRQALRILPFTTRQ